MEDKTKANYKQKNIINNKNNIKVIMLGGMGEVGKNSYAIEVLGDIFIVDYGVLFPSEEYIGVDYIIPNFTYLKENIDKIKGLFITHGHEDHIGGIPFLLKKLRIKKIYASKMSKLLIEKKLKEHRLEVTIQEIGDSEQIKINQTNIYTFHQTHSIPNAIGLFFETPIGNIVTTGDFKVDFSPTGEKMTDFHRIVKLANKGVDLLLADSTNSLRRGFSESSTTIGNNLKLLIKEAEGRILFTTFASHINRVEKIIEGALEDGRKICVLGRSMKNNIKIGMKAGYLKIKSNDIIDLKNVTKYPPNEVCIISTGSQGEELAALSRIAQGLNPNLEISEEDTIVFASSPIPGNSYNIGKIIDRLYKTKCKVIINDKNFKTHTSGHASKEEQMLMLSLFSPKHFLPIHGNYHMLMEHKKTGQEIGIKSENIYLVDNGDAIVIDNNNYTVLRNYTEGESMFVSGNNINVSLKDSNMTKIASNGLLILSLLIAENEKLVSYPQITTRGFVIISEEIELLKQIQRYFVKIYNEETKLKGQEKKVYLVKRLSKFIHNKTGKNPFVDINVIKYNPNKKLESKSKKNENKKETI